MSEKINPCPFCGSEDVFVIDEGWCSHVTCGKCGADGPFTEDDSFLEKWNNAAATELYEALLQAMASIDPEDLETFRVCNAALAKARGEL